MTKEEQLKELEKTYLRVQSTMTGKGDDYSKSDRLSNFKEVASMCGVSPQLVCLMLIATKVSRLGSLYASGKAPVNESVDDSILDLTVYSNLLNMIQIEQNNERSNKQPKSIQAIAYATST